MSQRGQRSVGSTVTDVAKTAKVASKSARRRSDKYERGRDRSTSYGLLWSRSSHCDALGWVAFFVSAHHELFSTSPFFFSACPRRHTRSRYPGKGLAWDHICPKSQVSASKPVSPGASVHALCSFASSILI